MHPSNAASVKLLRRKNNEYAFFLHRLLCVSSQMSAFSSGRCRARRPLGNLVTGQSSTICIIVCCGAPQSQQAGSVILVPAGKACCTSALNSSETIQCAPRATRFLMILVINITFWKSDVVRKVSQTRNSADESENQTGVTPRSTLDHLLRSCYICICSPRVPPHCTVWVGGTDLRSMRAMAMSIYWCILIHQMAGPASSRRVFMKLKVFVNIYNKMYMFILEI